MTHNGANPATGSVNGVRRSEQVATTLELQVTPTTTIFQVPDIRTVHELYGRQFRTRLIHAHRVVVRQNDGQPRSIPVFIRRHFLLARSSTHQ